MMPAAERCCGEADVFEILKEFSFHEGRGYNGKGICALHTFTTGAMVAAVLKLYLIGTALSVLAVFYVIVDSFGGLMYVQDDHYTTDQQTQRQISSGHNRK
ncbi:Hypoxia-inducible lipid droplet-associated protein [Dissostichus eleginoides]|uniref:Hypoxia-inducible lipid droplet-associated protein n=1 Tax=Dissostichus eleginoides TaxID=100907 RepID=A0AAD9CQN0_DISEL|nr:Hypoxia-inducible lipid droplet-associated protein [Dissostichus eleginoides]